MQRTEAKVIAPMTPGHPIYLVAIKGKKEVIEIEVDSVRAAHLIRVGVGSLPADITDMILTGGKSDGQGNEPLRSTGDEVRAVDD